MTSSRSSSAASDLALRAKAELERRRRGVDRVDPLVAYRYDPAGYIRDKLGWEPWAGGPDTPGQQEVIAAYERALRQQHERAAWEASIPRGIDGEPAEPVNSAVHSGAIDGADYSKFDSGTWQPGQVIKNRIRIEAGHTVGKTKLASGLVNHFYDTCPPAIVYTFAPTWTQIHDLLWKEIKTDRTGKGLPGRILDLQLDRGPNHFATGRATNDAGGKGTERVQGQHGRYLMFVLDEAEGIPDFVYAAIDSMASGGIVIVLMLANPRTRTSKFHKAAAASNVQSFRISCLHHPNVVAGRELVPGAVRREYVEDMIEKHCEVAAAHSDDDQTFTVPWRPGLIYKPNAEFMFRVLGVAPKNIADNTMIAVGRFEAACERPAAEQYPMAARMGVDVARFGKDMGTLYIRHNGRVWRAAQFAQADTKAYARRIKDEAAQLAAAGVTSLHIRVDGGGGFGGGVIDELGQDLDLMRMFVDFQVLEVHFNGVPYDWEAHGDLATELYADAGDALLRLRVEDPPEALSADLCERLYKWVNTRGVAVKKLEPKDEFRKRELRSPDDGDGFVLAVASDHIFTPKDAGLVTYDDPVCISPI